ncbi:hypothetical protein D9613_010707 [Agrocybe pediades]|uniref:Uncharacterized protein n=1 Tax=Agrocybe pediades TaxID=84607 RepID=A0A8H4QLA9_9AGAR|nr:hypothetical protein D9613_010707 [Agrocybe pediades]
MSKSIPQVFVDDSDPRIIYTGPQDAWVAQAEINTAPQPRTLADRPPFYGTRHLINSLNASLSYIFNGNGTKQFKSPRNFDAFINYKHRNNVTAVFSGGDPSEASPGGAPQPSGTSLPAFDDLFYTPSSIIDSELQEEDVAYSSDMVNVTAANTLGLAVPGNMVDFTFNGTSMALYATQQLGNNIPVGLSYHIDDGPFINFTLVVPSTIEESQNNQLIVQTAQYGRGLHHFHLDFLGGPSNQIILIDNIIAQNNPNTQKLVGLQVFPPVPSSSSSRSSNSQSTATLFTSLISSTRITHRIGQGAIIAIVVTLTLVILTVSIMVLKWRSRRPQSATGNTDLEGSEAMRVTPFIPTTFARRMTNTPSKRTPGLPPNPIRDTENISKANRRVVPLSYAVHTRASALEGPIPAPAAAPEAAPASPTTQDDTEEPIYRIHEDGGSVREVPSTVRGRRQIIDLPPLYSSNFGRRHQEATEEPNTGGQ